MNPQTASELSVLAAKRIEYPKLKQIGGVKYFTKHFLIKAAVTLLVATLAGYLGGHLAQQSFRQITGFRYEKTEIAEIEVREKLPTNARFQKDGNLFVNILSDTAAMTANAISAVTDSEVLKAANKASVSIINTALSPLLAVIDWVVFWFPFVLVFIGAAWLTNKLFTIKIQVLNNGVDPQVIKNMEILETKVKELVDRANASTPSD